MVFMALLAQLQEMAKSSKLYHEAKKNKKEKQTEQNLYNNSGSRKNALLPAIAITNVLFGWHAYGLSTFLLTTIFV